MDYKNYSVHDFIKDEFFFKWVLHPDPNTDHFWKKWMDAHPEKQETVNQARAFIERLNYKDNFAMSDAAYTRIFGSMMRHKKQQDIMYKDRVASRRKIGWYAAAAAILLVLASSAFFVYDYRENELPVYAAKVTKNVPLGSKLAITLSDGTQVKLNAGSSISYPEAFESHHREVYLKGEAFFEVTKDKTRPFVIHSNGLTTTVLGTSFNIRSYGEEETRVAVVSGLVEVTTAEGRSSFLHPESMAIYKPGESLDIRPFEPKKEIGWKDGWLFFDKMPLRQVFSTLESWYGVEIKVKGDISLEEPYSGEYQHENLENVLIGIGFTSGFTFALKGKQVEIIKSKQKNNEMRK